MHHTCIDFVEVSSLADYPNRPANDNHLQPPSAPCRTVPIDRIPEAWILSDALRSEARLAGVLDPDAHLARLKTGPVGGTRGIFPDQLEAYVRSLFGKWRTWEETDRAKALVKATGSPLPPPPSTERVPGWPKWIRKSVAAQVKAEGRDVRALAKLFAKTHHINPSNLDVAVAAQAFEQYLERVRKEAA